MRRGLKVSRGVQMFGAVLMVMGIVACSQKSDPVWMAQYFLIGGLMIVGARIYEWMTKE